MPCMCGGCRRCLHDQGYHCGDSSCCGPMPPFVTRIRLDPADYSWDGDCYRGHGDRLVVRIEDQEGEVLAEETFDIGQMSGPDTPDREAEREALEQLLEFVEAECDG